MTHAQQRKADEQHEKMLRKVARHDGDNIYSNITLRCLLRIIDRERARKAQKKGNAC